jgi:UDP-glucose 4-epimerase
MKTAIVTGVNGFLGGYIARWFSTNSWRVVGLDRSAPRPELLPHLTRFHQCGLPDPRFRALLREFAPAVCVHGAGRASVAGSWSELAEDFEAGPPLVFEMLDGIRQSSPQTAFLLLSSAAVYGNPERLPIGEDCPLAPISPYGYHKLQCEQLCAEFASCFGLKTGGLRIFSAYGPGLRRQVLWDICQKLALPGSAVFQGTGLETRDFVHAEDVAQAVWRIGTRAPLAGEMYNVATGRETSIAELVHFIGAQFASGCCIQFDGHLPEGVPRNWRADINKLGQLGYWPKISIEEGLCQVVAWYREEVLQACVRNSA